MNNYRSWMLRDPDAIQLVLGGYAPKVDVVNQFIVQAESSLEYNKKITKKVLGFSEVCIVDTCIRVRLPQAYGQRFEIATSGPGRAYELEYKCQKAKQLQIGEW